MRDRNHQAGEEGDEGEAAGDGIFHCFSLMVNGSGGHGVARPDGDLAQSLARDPLACDGTKVRWGVGSPGSTTG